MTSLPLTVVSQTKLAITLSWTPPAGAAGYVFYRDGKRVSSTFDGARSQAKFSIPDDGQPHTFAVRAIAALAEGTATVNTPTPPTPTVSLPRYRCHIYGSNQEAADGRPHSFAWLTRDSKTSEQIIDPRYPYPDRHSLIRWDKGHLYEGRETWLIEKFWPELDSSHVGCGRMTNGHSTPALGGWGWGNDVSPYAIQYANAPGRDDKSGDPYEGVHLVLEATGDSHEGIGGRYHWTILPVAEWDQHVKAATGFTLTHRIGWGNVTMGIPGAVTVWVDGQKRVDLQNVNTHWNTVFAGSNPGGGQPGLTFWFGGYVTPSNGLPPVEVGRYTRTMPKFGRTLDEAVQDWPISEFAHDQASTGVNGAPASFLEPLPAAQTELLLPAA